MVMFMNTVRTNNMSNMIVFALIIRLILIMLGCLIDNISDVKYTDVDYNVFTDASRLMWDGNSPYERDTYRYPPLLAFLLVPNIFFPSFGKVNTKYADVFDLELLLIPATSLHLFLCLTRFCFPCPTSGYYTIIFQCWK